MTIDAHQHFWQYDPVRYAWIDEKMSAIQKNFLPEDLTPILHKNGVDGCISVQAEQSEEETHVLLRFAKQHDFIKGVVGWVDLRSDKIEQRLEYWSDFPLLKGFRHIVQGEADVNFLLRSDFRRGLKALEKYDFTYDILVFPHQLGAVLEFVRAFPDQPFIVDHLAKPYIKDGFFDGWATLMRAIAQQENVYCKLSGMITEADWQHWKGEDFKPYLDLVLEVFGPRRSVFGSDWPVCLVAGAYAEVKGIITQYIEPFSATEKSAIMGENALRFYRIEE